MATSEVIPMAAPVTTGVKLGQASCLAEEAYLLLNHTLLLLDEIDIDLAEGLAPLTEKMAALAALLLRAADDYGHWEVARTSPIERSNAPKLLDAGWRASSQKTGVQA